jgi:hypothetical protein
MENRTEGVAPVCSSPGECLEMASVEVGRLAGAPTQDSGRDSVEGEVLRSVERVAEILECMIGANDTYEYQRVLEGSQAAVRALRHYVDASAEVDARRIRGAAACLGRSLGALASLTGPGPTVEADG